jgi:hypothetical protein
VYDPRLRSEVRVSVEIANATGFRAGFRCCLYSDEARDLIISEYPLYTRTIFGFHFNDICIAVEVSFLRRFGSIFCSPFCSPAAHSPWPHISRTR